MPGGSRGGGHRSGGSGQRSHEIRRSGYGGGWYGHPYEVRRPYEPRDRYLEEWYSGGWYPGEWYSGGWYPDEGYPGEWWTPSGVSEKRVIGVRRQQDASEADRGPAIAVPPASLEASGPPIGPALLVLLFLALLVVAFLSAGAEESDYPRGRPSVDAPPVS